MTTSTDNPTPTSFIFKENLIIALELAISVRQVQEFEDANYTADSALLAGWKENLQSLKNGKLEIK